MRLCSNNRNHQIPKNPRPESRNQNGVQRPIKNDNVLINRSDSSLPSFRALVSRGFVALDSFRIRYGRGRYFLLCMIFLLHAVVLTLCFDTHPQSRRRLPVYGHFPVKTLLQEKKSGKDNGVCGFIALGTLVKRNKWQSNENRVCYYNPTSKVFIALDQPETGRRESSSSQRRIKEVLVLKGEYTIEATWRYYGLGWTGWWAELTATKLQPLQGEQGWELFQKLANPHYVDSRMSDKDIKASILLKASTATMEKDTTGKKNLSFEKSVTQFVDALRKQIDPDRDVW